MCLHCFNTCVCALSLHCVSPLAAILVNRHFNIFSLEKKIESNLTKQDKELHKNSKHSKSSMLAVYRKGTWSRPNRFSVDFTPVARFKGILVCCDSRHHFLLLQVCAVLFLFTSDYRLCSTAALSWALPLPAWHPRRLAAGCEHGLTRFADFLCPSRATHLGPPEIVPEIDVHLRTVDSAGSWNYSPVADIEQRNQRWDDGASVAIVTGRSNLLFLRILIESLLSMQGELLNRDEGRVAKKKNQQTEGPKWCSLFRTMLALKVLSNPLQF